MFIFLRIRIDQLVSFFLAMELNNTYFNWNTSLILPDKRLG